MTTSTFTDNHFSLPPNATLRTITTIHQDLLEFVAHNDATVVEFAPDSQIDISILQLLEAARIYAGTGGKAIVLAKPATGTLLDTLRRSGFLEGMSNDDANFWLHQGEIQ
ncbi:STAS domain-containing protein [Neorhizobium lilium]|uniref:STAS domain-containing protein n=1 Tax=Neorhizobium lilium TaxID=2503024 RepID=A0A444LES0_9HYPH|nr:STAS domain-containing protein [Neorhizobium lilium]RWX76530.1 STAS domain-containing protein [Neorhizobium lilium]